MTAERPRRYQSQSAPERISKKGKFSRTSISRSRIRLCEDKFCESSRNPQILSSRTRGWFVHPSPPAVRSGGREWLANKSENPSSSRKCGIFPRSPAASSGLDGIIPQKKAEFFRRILVRHKERVALFASYLMPGRVQRQYATSQEIHHHRDTRVQPRVLHGTDSRIPATQRHPPAIGRALSLVVTHAFSSSARQSDSSGD